MHTRKVLVPIGEVFENEKIYLYTSVITNPKTIHTSYSFTVKIAMFFQLQELMNIMHLQ